MLNCKKCGHELFEDARFCPYCGHSVYATSRETYTEYAGKLVTCICCGERIDAFEEECSSCGYELRGARVSDAIQSFECKWESAKTSREKSDLIRRYSVPNTREDIIEFFLLIIASVDRYVDENVLDAWKAKSEQLFRRAELVCKNEKKFRPVQKLYERASDKIQTSLNDIQQEKRKERNARRVESFRHIFLEITPVIPSLIVCIGWIICLLILLAFSTYKLDNVGTNSYQLFYMFVLVAGAFFIPMFLKGEMGQARIVTTLGLFLLLIVLVLLCGRYGDNSAHEIILVIHVICSAVILGRMIKGKPETSEKHGKVSLMISVSSIVLFVFVYLISSIVVFIKDDSEKEDETYKATDDFVKNYENELQWPVTGIGDLLPDPVSKYGEVDINRDDSFKMYIYKVDGESYDEYVTSCIEKGFVVESSTYDDAYLAYNAEGYQLRLEYSKDDEEISVILKAPIEVNEIKWPKTGVAKSLPKPSSTKGKISSDSSTHFSVYVGNITLDEFNEYIDLCIDEGFDVDYSRHEKAFYAENKKGLDLTVTYEGFNTIYISIFDWSD